MILLKEGQTIARIKVLEVQTQHCVVKIDPQYARNLREGDQVAIKGSP